MLLIFENNNLEDMKQISNSCDGTFIVRTSWKREWERIRVLTLSSGENVIQAKREKQIDTLSTKQQQPQQCVAFSFIANIVRVLLWVYSFVYVCRLAPFRICVAAKRYEREREEDVFWCSKSFPKLFTAFSSRFTFTTYLRSLVYGWSTFGKKRRKQPKVFKCDIERK